MLAPLLLTRFASLASARALALAALLEGPSPAPSAVGVVVWKRREESETNVRRTRGKPIDRERHALSSLPTPLTHQILTDPSKLVAARAAAAASAGSVIFVRSVMKKRDGEKLCSAHYSLFALARSFLHDARLPARVRPSEWGALHARASRACSLLSPSDTATLTATSKCGGTQTNTLHSPRIDFLYTSSLSLGRLRCPAPHPTHHRRLHSIARVSGEGWAVGKLVSARTFFSFPSASRALNLAPLNLLSFFVISPTSPAAPPAP